MAMTAAYLAGMVARPSTKPPKPLREYLMGAAHRRVAQTPEEQRSMLDTLSKQFGGEVRRVRG
jgi:hypothetical protein